MKRALKEPSSCKFILGVLRHSSVDYPTILKKITESFGVIQTKTEEFVFGSEYYKPEMGEGLKKSFLSFEGVVPRSILPERKIASVKLEDFFAKPDGSRLVNLDPMILSLENVIIATSKNFSHRVYLGQGVFGDLALIRKREGFESLPWTYADYLENLSFFESVREMFKREFSGK